MARSAGWFLSSLIIFLHYTVPMNDAHSQRERIFTGVKFAVDRVPVRTHDGWTVMRELIVHGGAVLVLPIMDDGRVVMIRNQRFAVEKELWELCAGTLEAGEDPRKCAARELIEETGYEAKSIEKLCEFYTSPGMTNEWMRVFLARDLTHVGQRLEATEQIKVELCQWKDVLEMVRKGEIVDGKTIAGILYYERFGKHS
ncbi:MAG: NUDIX hydrolase [Phycisphaerales bacterium]